MNEARLVPIEAVMAAFSLPRSTVYQLVHESAMPSYKPGKKLLFDLDVVEAWIKEHWAHAQRGSYSRHKQRQRARSPRVVRVLNGEGAAVATPLP